MSTQTQDREHSNVAYEIRPELSRPSRKFELCKSKEWNSGFESVKIKLLKMEPDSFLH